MTTFPSNITVAELSEASRNLKSFDDAKIFFVRLHKLIEEHDKFSLTCVTQGVMFGKEISVSAQYERIFMLEKDFRIKLQFFFRHFDVDTSMYLQKKDPTATNPDEEDGAGCWVDCADYHFRSDEEETVSGFFGVIEKELGSLRQLAH